MRITASSSNQKRCEGAASRSISGRLAKLGEHYAGRELAGVTEREVFDYLIHRREVEKLRPSTLNQAVVALRMFYRDYLGKRWALWERFEIRAMGESRQAMSVSAVQNALRMALSASGLKKKATFHTLRKVSS
jgi:Phage integrase, N-terminal SAM-like domain